MEINALTDEMVPLIVGKEQMGLFLSCVRDKLRVLNELKERDLEGRYNVESESPDIQANVNKLDDFVYDQRNVERNVIVLVMSDK